MSKIAIFGFGRIGRSTLKAALSKNLFIPEAVADIRDADTFAALFAFDTNYGRWHEDVSVKGRNFVIGGREIAYLDSSQSVPDWGNLGVDLVIDCTGRATRREGAEAHLERGAKKVLVSAPSKTREDADAVLLPGINLDTYDPEHHHIVSMASCTTNALGPIVKVVLENFGLTSGLFSTVHAYTSTQSLTDQPFKDRRDSWAAAENIIPSSSGAAKALNFIWPELKITGKAYRVPVRTGSIVELNATIGRATTEDELRDVFREAARSGPLYGVMGVLEDEYASARILGEELSSVIDLPLIQVMEGSLVSIAGWYDNEMGYATRLAEAANYITQAQ